MFCDWNVLFTVSNGCTQISSQVSRAQERFGAQWADAAKESVLQFPYMSCARAWPCSSGLFHILLKRSCRRACKRNCEQTAHYAQSQPLLKAFLYWGLWFKSVMRKHESRLIFSEYHLWVCLKSSEHLDVVAFYHILACTQTVYEDAAHTTKTCDNFWLSTI